MAYLLTAFSAIWIVLFLYLLSLSRRQRALTRELEDLRQVLKQKDSVRSIVLPIKVSFL
jgi:CcmD family protein